MPRLPALVCALLVSGCAAETQTGPRTGELIPAWQQRKIIGDTRVGGPSTGSIEAADGPVGVRLKGRGQTTVYPGGDAIAAPRPGLTYTSQGEITLSFNDVDAKEAAATVLEDILNLTYVIDPRIEGKITLHNARPIAPKEALRLLETGLQQVGAVVIIRNGVHYVVPRGASVPEAPNAIQPAGRNVAGYSSRAVQLRNIAAAEMAEILKPTAKEAGVRVDGARNLLILSGTAAEHEAWMETVRTFDVDWLANRSVGVFKIANQPADSMVKSLNEVMRNENVDQQMVRFTTIDSTNSVLAVAKSPEALGAVRQWVKRLEAAGAQQQQLYSYQMKYAQARDVAPVLAKIFGIQLSAADLAGSGKGTTASKTSTSASSGFQTTASASTPSAAPQPSSAPASASVASQASAAPALTAAMSISQPSLTGAHTMALQGAATGDGAPSTTLRIIPNEGTNTLLVYGTDAEYDRVKNVLRTVDVPQRQVLVEATIIEVALTDDLRFGVQYYLSSQGKGLPFDLTLSNGTSSSVAPNLPGFGLTLGSPAKVVIDSLSDVTRVNIVSAPNVMVLNNQSARLQVGDQVPITTKSSQDPLQGNQVIVNTIEMRDTGVIFEVTPRINSSGSVLLDIVQEVSAVKEQSNASLTPTISQRKLSSSVTVDNGETIVLGGLFSTQGTLSRSGLPGLSSLPWVGSAFGTTKDNSVRTELVVLISPRIIDNRFDARAATNEVRRRVQELRFDDAAPVSAPVPAPHRSLKDEGSLKDESGACKVRCGAHARTAWGATTTE